MQKYVRRLLGVEANSNSQLSRNVAALATAIGEPAISGSSSRFADHEAQTVHVEANEKSVRAPLRHSRFSDHESPSIAAPGAAVTINTQSIYCQGSHVGRAPMSDDDSPEVVPAQHALWQPQTSKPWSFGSKPVNGLFKVSRTGGELNGVGVDPKWEFMPYPLVVDSGAAETVLPSAWFINHKLHESEGSRMGAVYTAANGGELENEGEKHLYLATVEGDQVRKMDFQVTDVTKALGSVSRMVHNGNRVVFDLDEWGANCSYIESKSTGKRLWLRERNGVYVLDVMVAPPGYQGEMNKHGKPKGSTRPSGR